MKLFLHRKSRKLTSGNQAQKNENLDLKKETKVNTIFLFSRMNKFRIMRFLKLYFMKASGVFKGAVLCAYKKFSYNGTGKSVKNYKTNFH